MFKMIHQREREWTVASLDKFWVRFCLNAGYILKPTGRT